MKKLLMLALAAAPLCANSQSVVVNLTSGESVKYPISSITDITFEVENNPVVEPIALSAFTDHAVLEAVRAFDTDGDAELSVEELAEITSLNLSSSTVESLAGLELLPYLKELNLQSCNSLISADSSEGYPSLEYLQLSFCNNLETVTLGNIPTLQTLFLNYTKVADIDLSGATGLVNFGARSAKLTSLAITNSPNLDYFSIGNDGLTSVEISSCEKVTEISIANASYIPDSDAMKAFLAKFPALQSISIENYPGGKITTEANPELRSLTLNNCSSLYSVDVHKSMKLNSLTQYGSYDLEELIMTEGQIINTLSGFSDWMIQRIPREYPDDVASTIEDEIFRQAILDAADLDKDGKITEEEARALTVFNAPNAGLTTVDFDWFPNLVTVDLSGNELETLDVSSFTKVEALNVANNKLTSIDMSRLDALKVLIANNNKLTEIYPAGSRVASSAIESIDLAYNELTSVNIYYKSKLKSLDLSHNKLVSGNMRIDQNTALADLDLSYNNLTELTIWSLKALVNANFSNNPFIQLDEANNWVVLETIDCSNTQIPTLNLSKTTELKKCVATDCPNLTTIYIGANTAAEIVKGDNTELVEGEPAQ